MDVAKVTSYDVDYLWYHPGERVWKPMHGSPPAGVLDGPNSLHYCTAFQEIPCGKCVGCRMDQSRQWADRCMLELEYHETAWFVTLTYDEEHAPRSMYVDPGTGEAMPSMTLLKDDFQRFMKRLRFAIAPKQVRFFAAGEYGGVTFRPHYHAIIFGLELNDLVYYKQSPDGRFTYYNSPFIQKVWSEHGQTLGFAVVAPVTWETCAYVARYTMKKLRGKEAEFYDNFGLQPPFSLMSRNPGIARQWYEDHPDLYDYEYINLKLPDGGRKLRPPRYYDKLYDIDYPLKSQALKETRRKMAELAREAKLTRTNLPFLQMLETQERVFNGKIKKLKRCLDDEKSPT